MLTAPSSQFVRRKLEEDSFSRAIRGLWLRGVAYFSTLEENVSPSQPPSRRHFPCF